MSLAMRGWPILMLMFCLLHGAGCAVFPDGGQATASFLRRPNSQSIDDQVVQLDVAILEKPLGDHFLNQDLWQNTDEMVVALDRKGTLEDNGFRVGKVVGMTPGKLLDLLKSERYCSNPTRRFVPTGHNAPQFLSPIWPRTEIVVQQGAQTHVEAFDQARFCLDVKATLTDDNKTRLSFTPKVENGEMTLPFEPVPEQSAWTLRVERPCKTYPDLSWDVVLAPGEYVVIGPMLEKEKSLGYRSFVQDGGKQVQRLLVLRTSRATKGIDTGEPTLENLARGQTTPCLAQQASISQFRAHRD